MTAKGKKTKGNFAMTVRLDFRDITLSQAASIETFIKDGFSRKEAAASSATPTIDIAINNQSADKI